MKTRFGILMVAAVFLACMNTSAQSGNSQDETDSRQLAARCAYTQSEYSCESRSQSNPSVGDGPRSQAQFPPQGPRFRPRMPGPYGPHPYSYGPYDDGHHAVIGGLIGFGAGFALGAGTSNNSDTRVGRGLIAGGLGALFGAAIGHAIATFPHASFRRHRWSDDDDDWAAAKRTPRDPHESPSSGN